MINVTWTKCEGDVWCRLNNVNLSANHFDNIEGVYLIWHTQNDSAYVRVGQGNIRDRLTAHRNDSDVQQYVNLDLRVTWAQVDARYRDGVEAYLAQQLNPLVGERFPDVTPIAVNLPG